MRFPTSRLRKPLNTTSHQGLYFLVADICRLCRHSPPSHRPRRSQAELTARARHEIEHSWSVHSNRDFKSGRLELEPNIENHRFFVLMFLQLFRSIRDFCMAAIENPCFGCCYPECCARPVSLSEWITWFLFAWWGELVTTKTMRHRQKIHHFWLVKVISVTSPSHWENISEAFHDSICRICSSLGWRSPRAS